MNRRISTPSSPWRHLFAAVALTAAVQLAACKDSVSPSDPGLPERIVFSSNPVGTDQHEQREVFTVAPDGTGATQLTSGMRAIAPAWSPDGTMITFGSMAEGDLNIYVVNADGSGLRAATSGPDANYHPSWSADGERVVFTRVVAGSAREQLFTARPDGGGLAMLHDCEVGCQWPMWSPDGARVVFVGWPDRGGATRHPQLQVLDVDAGSVVTLATSLLWGHFPSWSPDGTRLAFVGSEDAVRYDLFSVSRDGSGLSRLTDDGVTRWSPAYSRDGSRIVFYQAAEGAEGIYSMAASGGDIRPILPFAEPQQYFVTPRWRP